MDCDSDSCAAFAAAKQDVNGMPRSDAMAPVSKRARRGKPRAEDAEDASRDVVVDEEPSTSGARASGAPVYSADARRIELRPGAPVCVDGACVATCVAGECWIGGYHLSCDAPRDVVIRSASGIGSVVAAESSAPAALGLLYVSLLSSRSSSRRCVLAFPCRTAS